MSRRSGVGRHSCTRAAGVLLACIGVALALGVIARSAAPRRAPSFAVAKSYEIGRTPGAVSIADLNGDRTPDVVTTNSFGQAGNTISVLLNRGGGRLASGVEYRVGLHPFPAKIRDLNGDGKPDVAVVSCSSVLSRSGLYISRCRVSVRLNRGDGRFAAPDGYRVGGGLTVADLNRDHRPDLVSVISSRAVSVLMNKGDGTFESKVDYGVGKASGVSVRDLNGDGAPDLAVANDKVSRISVLLNRGDGTFLPRREYVTGRGPSWVSIADLNGDGRRDVLAWNCRSGTFSVLLNKGGGAFRHTHDYPLGVCGGPLAVADLNGDGRPDLVGNMWKTGIVVLLNRGDGSFGARRRYPALRGCDAGDVWPSGDCGEIAVRDVNGDGRPDLAVASTGANGVEVQLNRGNGTFAAKLGYGSLGGPIAFGVSDLNRDGRPDLITANYSSKSVGVLLNKPGLCNVQDVSNETLQSARQELARANCRVLKVRRAHSRIKAGRVISQRPTFGAVLANGGEANLVVSEGPRR